MKKIVYSVTSFLLLFASTSAFSQYDGHGDDRVDEDRFGNERLYDRNEESGYESSFGNRYEYDLSDPVDRIMYEVDPDAQLRDSIDVNPEKDLERSLGEYGGGVLDDR